MFDCDGVWDQIMAAKNLDRLVSLARFIADHADQTLTLESLALRAPG